MRDLQEGDLVVVVNPDDIYGTYGQHGYISIVSNVNPHVYFVDLGNESHWYSRDEIYFSRESNVGLSEQ